MVRTSNTPLNVRTGPSTRHQAISRVDNGTRHDVLMWAWDENTSSRTNNDRWFLISDGNSVRGWVSGRFVDLTNVNYTN